MCSNNQNNCLSDILETILILQQQDQSCDIDNSCSKPFLGPSSSLICFNTRPINIYSCCNNILWSMPYTLNDVEETSNVFRIENLSDECATFRVLAPNTDTTTQTTNPYISTNDFFTIKLSCIGAIKCLGDTNVSLI